MLRLLRVCSADDFESITDLLHDMSFDVREIEYDEGSGYVSLRMTPEQSIWGALFRKLSGKRKLSYLFVIKNVLNLDVSESENIAVYSVNAIRFVAGKVVVESSVPLHFELHVSDICIEVYEEKQEELR